MKQSGSVPRYGALRGATPTAAALALCAGSLAACGSSPAAGHTSRPAAQTACLQLSEILSNGPDPDADPVGYAEAQTLPLHQIHTSFKTIGSAIDRNAAPSA